MRDSAGNYSRSTKGDLKRRAERERRAAEFLRRNPIPELPSERVLALIDAEVLADDGAEGGA